MGVLLKQNHTVKSQIFRLLSVIGAGVLGALAITGFLLYRYGPTGSYQASNALLTLDVIQKLSFVNDPHKEGKNASRYVFNDIIWYYQDENTRQWNKKNISLGQYEAIYQLLSKDKSLTDSIEEIQSEFMRAQPAALTLTVKQENNPQSSTMVLEEIQMIPHGNLYRIKLMKGGPEVEDWVYFEHPQIYQKVSQLINRTD